MAIGAEQNALLSLGSHPSNTTSHSSVAEMELLLGSIAMMKLESCRRQKASLKLSPDALGSRDAFDEGRSLAAELGAALVVVALAGGGDLGLEAALLEQ
jgi:hypothetical protein